LTHVLFDNVESCAPSCLVHAVRPRALCSRLQSFSSAQNTDVSELVLFFFRADVLSSFDGREACLSSCASLVKVDLAELGQALCFGILEPLATLRAFEF